MRAVTLNRLLSLEQAVHVPDGAGGFTITWQELGRLWTEILPGAGRDTGGEEFTNSSVPYRITVRAAPQGAERRPLAGQRLRDGMRVFHLLAVTEHDAFGQYLTCFAREEDPA